MMHSKIKEIFVGTEVKHGLSLFTEDELSAVEDQIHEEAGRLYIKCLIKEKYKVAKPEEIVKQVFIRRLLVEYGYPRGRIDVERVIYFGSRDSGLADIVVLHEDLVHPYIIVETKRPKRKDGLEQLKSYCNAEGAPIGLWLNGNEMIRLHREEPNIFVEIPGIPKVTETLRDILTERWKIGWLEEHDELQQGKTTLKKIILDLEELVLSGAGVSSFEEIFKLIYAKLYDEWNGINNADYQLEFFVGDRSSDQLKKVIGKLLEGAKRQWSGVFELTDRIELRSEHLKVCVSFLEKIKLFNSNLRIIDEAFEYLIPQESKKKEGQFFTPRAVEDMLVKMLNPKPHEFVIDPACGSAGFLLHSVIWVDGGAITGRELSPVGKNFAQNNVFGIDFSQKAVRIAKAINLIVGDGKSHVYKDDALIPRSWNDQTRAGLKPMVSRFVLEPDKDSENLDNYLYLDFDVLMTNPPFAGTVTGRDVLRFYELGEKNARVLRKAPRHIIFLNRSLQLIRPGGRMAIILPQGLLNNLNLDYVRRFVIDNARILAVVGLHVNTFKTHTGTKTSALLLQKYTEEEKQAIQNIKAKYASKWETFIARLREDYQNVGRETTVDESGIQGELKSFLATNFAPAEIEIESDTDTEVGIGTGYDDESSIEDSTQNIKKQLEELQLIINAKEQELGDTTIAVEKRPSKREIKTLYTKLDKFAQEASQKTLGGQISLTLHDNKITEQFKRFWLDTKAVEEIDYPIFFAVNQLPVKDNSGEYRYKTNPNGDLLFDDNGHPLIDHDLDEIGDAFLTFAKDQRFDFWDT